MIVVGSMISLAYYLRLLAAMWMRGRRRGRGPDGRPRPRRRRPALAGGSPELGEELSSACRAKKRPQPEVVFVAVLAGAATLFFGLIPQPLFDLVHGAGSGLGLFGAPAPPAGRLRSEHGVGASRQAKGSLDTRGKDRPRGSV